MPSTLRYFCHEIDETSKRAITDALRDASLGWGLTRAENLLGQKYSIMPQRGRCGCCEFEVKKSLLLASCGSHIVDFSKILGDDNSWDGVAVC